MYMVIGMFDEEIDYLDEADPMKDMMNEKSHDTSHSAKTPSTATNTEFAASTAESFISPRMFGTQDDDSVSTIGNSIQQRWNPSTQNTNQFVQRPSPLRTRNDDKSTSSISTLTTRLTTMEVQYQQISGDVQDIKNLLAVLARSSTSHSAQDEAPTNGSNAGQSQASTGDGS